VSRRNAIAHEYDNRLAELSLVLPHRAHNRNSAWHLYVIRVAASARFEIFNAMRVAGVAVNVHYTPVHLQPYYRKLGFAPGQFPNSEAYGAEAITLPLYPTLSISDIELVVTTLAKALEVG
jgi:dTDP-4-amino-4,6-dideoxygalactose transaminase